MASTSSSFGSGAFATNASNFLSAKLQSGEVSNNYTSWREQMLCLIESQDLVGLINGEVDLEQGKMKSEDYVVWRRCDRLVKGWILGSICDELARRCVGFDSARHLWLELEHIFTRPPPPHVDHHQEQLEYYDNLKLYKAAVRGDWDSTRSILEEDPEAGEARVSFYLETPLHVALGSGKALHYVKKLVQNMSDEALALGDRLGRTALHIAASTGNTAAAKVLVDRVPALVYEQARKGWFPIHAAARCAHRDTLEFLISKTKDDLELNPYAGSSGVLLLCLVIDADFYDIALRLVGKYPDLARMKHGESNTSALERLSLRESAFPSGDRFSFWERVICLYPDIVWRELRKPIIYSSNNGCCFFIKQLFQKWVRLWLFSFVYLFALPLTILVSRTRRIYAKKLMQRQAIQLAECLCTKMAAEFRENGVTSIYNSAMMTAAGLGIHEVVEAIVETFPDAVHARRDGHYFYQVAAANRCEKVFNLIYQTRDHKHLYSDITDSHGNTILHLVARLAPPNKLNLVSGAALQMQRELQWFKQVEEFVHPYAREVVNDDGKTPKMVFMEEHKLLKAEGEKWMKDTANSYIIVAALIATVVFAAAITVPGGNNSSTGYPVFTKSSGFIFFAISDAGSLFTSITSLLMFLSIMTSRYAEEDFLYALPKRLCIGLFTLFVSIFFMMVAFSASTYMVLGQEQKWVLIPVAALASLPVASFVLLQFPLLWDVISSTYGGGIFARQTEPLHSTRANNPLYFNLKIN